MKEKRRICIIGPALKMGGMERASVNLANTLSESASVTFISFFKTPHFFQLNENIELYEPQGFNKNSLSIMKTLPWIRRSIKRIDPEKIIVFNKLYSALSVLALAFTTYPVYISERSSPLYKWPVGQEWLSRLIFFFFKPDGIIAQTQIAAEYQQKYYGSHVNIEVIPNALRAVRQFPAIKREKIILAVGRLNDPLKGFDRLLKSIALIDLQEWKLYIAGGSRGEDPILDAIMEHHQLDDRVKFLGKVSNIDELFAKAGLFVIPSRSEGFPNALCEAMAAGLACISFDFIAGPRDIINDGVDGFIVEDGNLDALGEKITYLINHPKVRQDIGHQAKRTVERYDASEINQQVLQFLTPS